jgi:hypothetical protein
MTKIIIAITGSNGSGKDTVGKYLLSKLSKQYKISTKSFSEQVNQLYFKFTGISFYKLNREDKEIARPAYIKFAQGIKELTNKNCWACLLTQGLKPSESYIITDLRFQEEYNQLAVYCKDNNCRLIVLDILSDKDKEWDELSADFSINNKQKDYKSMQIQIDNFIKHFNL